MNEEKEQRKLDEELVISCTLGHTKVVQLLLENSADVNTTDKDGNSPLHHACSRGHTDVVRLLLKNDANVNAINNEDNTPLYIACRYGHTIVVKLLLENGANVNTTYGKGWSPLRIAHFLDYIDIEDLLKVCIKREEFKENKERK
jgi:ankyrin repeat protein